MVVYHRAFRVVDGTSPIHVVAQLFAANFSTATAPGSWTPTADLLNEPLSGVADAGKAFHDLLGHTQLAAGPWQPTLDNTSGSSSSSDWASAGPDFCQKHFLDPHAGVPLGDGAGAVSSALQQVFSGGNSTAAFRFVRDVEFFAPMVSAEGASASAIKRIMGDTAGFSIKEVQQVARASNGALVMRSASRGGSGVLSSLVTRMVMAVVNLDSGRTLCDVRLSIEYEGRFIGGVLESASISASADAVAALLSCATPVKTYERTSLDPFSSSSEEYFDAESDDELYEQFVRSSTRATRHQRRRPAPRQARSKALAELQSTLDHLRHSVMVTDARIAALTGSAALNALPDARAVGLSDATYRIGSLSERQSEQTSRLTSSRAGFETRAAAIEATIMAAQDNTARYSRNGLLVLGLVCWPIVSRRLWDWLGSPLFERVHRLAGS